MKVQVSNKVFALALAALVLLMFSFAYANVPLFKMFCERFGLDNSGKARITGGAAPVSSATANFKARNVRVKFMGVSGTGLPVRFGSRITRTQDGITAHHPVLRMVRHGGGRL